MRESKTLEFKTEISNTFLKTVSAFANYGTGEIWFGADDHGNPIGVENAAERCLDIENRINDLHESNIGYKNDRPIILDFSGFDR